MDLVKHNSVHYSENLNWLLQQPWLKDNRKGVLLALLVGSTSIVFGRIAYPLLRNGICSLWVVRHGDLPIGLPNNSNLCYLNALLQAMSSSRILVKSLRHRAAVKRDRLLCSLVTVLEGLGCSFDYLERHDLIEAIIFAHRTLVDELSLTGRWTVNDQQDVHELYAFFMDQAEESGTGQTALRSDEDLLALSRLPLFPPISASGDTPSAVATTATGNTCGVRQFGLSAYLSPHLPTFSATSFLPSSFHQFIVSQIFCTKCSYHGELRLVPEYCIILFPDKSRRLHTKKMSSKGKVEYRCSVETMLNDEFCAAERLTGIHCPKCHMEALRIPEAMVNDPSPLVSDRSSIRHFAESLCRNTCCARRWIALPPTAPTTTTTVGIKSPLVIYIQRAVWIPLKRIAPDADEYVRNFTAGGMMSKFTENIIFSDTLDLAPYLASGCTFNALTRRNNARCRGEKSKKKCLRYVLRSVIVHHGNTLHAGHYVAYRCWRGGGAESGASTNEWILSSDRYVSPVSFSRVKDCQAYMLFYEPMEADISDATHPSTLTERGINGAVVDVEEAEMEEDRFSEGGVGLEEVVSPARRIRAFMAMVCGEGELS